MYVFCGKNCTHVSQAWYFVQIIFPFQNKVIMGHRWIVIFTHKNIIKFFRLPGHWMWMLIDQYLSANRSARQKYAESNRPWDINNILLQMRHINIKTHKYEDKKRGWKRERKKDILYSLNFVSSCRSRHSRLPLPLLFYTSVSRIQRPWADDPMTWRSWCSYRRYEVTDERHCNLCRVIGCTRDQMRFSGHQVYVPFSCKINILHRELYERLYLH